MIRCRGERNVGESPGAVTVSRGTLLIVNPAAGGGRAARALDRVLEELAPLRPFDVYVTQPGEARPAEHAARDAVLAGVERILVLGGDGSSSQAANGIYAAGEIGRAHV